MLSHHNMTMGAWVVCAAEAAACNNWQALLSGEPAVAGFLRTAWSETAPDPEALLFGLLRQMKAAAVLLLAQRLTQCPPGAAATCMAAGVVRVVALQGLHPLLAALLFKRLRWVQLLLLLLVIT
jgi:hypothetical protein